MVAPHISVMRLICCTFSMGMRPGTMGCSMPMARHRSTKLKKSLLS